jgi:transposase
MIELDEVFFRFQQGQSLMQIARSVGQARNTVKRYLRLAQESGLTRGGGEAERQAAIRTARQKLAGHEDPEGTATRKLLVAQEERIRALLGERHMTMKQVWRLLSEDKLPVSYTSVKRFIRDHVQPKRQRLTMRMETPPGRQAQVDFGQVEVTFTDGSRRRLWAFLMTLSHSRHRFVRFVERQDVATWIDCHVRAFEFFGGVPETVLLDNLKAGVIKPDLYDPTLNRAYGELERHYGFVIDPARVAAPKDKGKVERGVPVVRQQLVAGRRYRDLSDLNEKALLWCRDAVGREIHGTTQEPPLVRFERDERLALKPLPERPFDPPTWAELKVHPDHHIVFERSYYSLPSRYVGKTVWARGTSRLIEIFCEDVLVKSHPRAARKGTWVTDQSDLPEAAQAFLFAHPIYCQEKAAELGPHVARMAAEILSGHAIRNLRKAQALLRLGQKYGAERLDQACHYLLSFDSTEIRRLERVLEQGVPTLWRHESPATAAPLSQQAFGFLHPPESFSASGEVLQ